MRKVGEIYFFAQYYWKKDANYQKCLKILEDFKDIFAKAPGSRKSHHDYEGGYLDHTMEVFGIANLLYHTLQREHDRKYHKKLTFTAQDAYLVLFLHDIEKPFKYIRQENATEEEFSELKSRLSTKQGREKFRLDLIAKYGIELTPAQQNALKYVEGENDDYVPGERVMNELAAFCHACDVLSARILWNKPAKGRSNE